jgi:prepilin-type N-terminal cleavage/methylation domain-containing protein
MKKFKKKGFTLVEIIVVMLILAILMGMFIPNLSGYIERTHETEAIMECRSTVIAVQTMLNQTYAYKNASFEAVYNDTEYSIKTSISSDKDSVNLRSYKGMDEQLNAVICGMAETMGEIEYIETDKNCRLIILDYISENGIKVEYDYDSESGYMVMND